MSAAILMQDVPVGKVPDEDILGKVPDEDILDFIESDLRIALGLIEDLQEENLT